jgi:hypothetical protein
MTAAHRCLDTLLITLLPISVAIQIVMLIIILRPIPISYYHITIVRITIISDQLHSIYDFAYKRRRCKSVMLKDYVILAYTISIKGRCFLSHVN